MTGTSCTAPQRRKCLCADSKSRKPYNQEAQEILSVIPKDRSNDAYIAAAWKQELEASGPTRVYGHVSDTGEGVNGEDLS